MQRLKEGEQPLPTVETAIVKAARRMSIAGLSGEMQGDLAKLRLRRQNPGALLPPRHETVDIEKDFITQ